MLQSLDALLPCWSIHLPGLSSIWSSFPLHLFCARSSNLDPRRWSCGSLGVELAEDVLVFLQELVCKAKTQYWYGTIRWAGNRHGRINMEETQKLRPWNMSVLTLNESHFSCKLSYFESYSCHVFIGSKICLFMNWKTDVCSIDTP